MVRKALAILLCVNEISWAAISFVNSAKGQDVTGTPIATLSAGALNVTAGNMLVVTVGHATTANVPTSVTDTAGNTFVHPAGADITNGGGSGGLLSVFYVLSAIGNASDIVKVTFSENDAFDAIIVRQYSGGTFSADVADATANGAAGTTATSASFSTAQANEVIVASSFNNQITQGYVAGTIGGVSATNLVADAASGSEFAASEDLIVSAIQSSITGTFTLNSANWAINIVSFSAVATTARQPGVIINGGKVSVNGVKMTVE